MTDPQPQTPPHDEDPLAPSNDPAATAGDAGGEDALRSEITALKDQMLRILAEADNTRKRAERDRDDILKYSISNFARDLINVADNLRRALDAIPADLRETDTRVQSLMDGIEATERDLLKAFDKHGLKKLEPLDEPFNPNFHEVMFETPASGKAAGTIVQLVEAGYTIHDRLLRPARVGVAKADPGEPPLRVVDEKA